MYERLYPIDSKAFSLKESNRISYEGAVSYRKGWSLRDIAREFGCSKNKVRAEIQKAGQEIREGAIQAIHNRKADAGKQGALPYFGFCYFEGRIVPDSREFPTLKLIHRLWKQEKTIHQITQELNRSKILSRKMRPWSWAAVQNIVKRLEEKRIVLLKGGRFEFR